MLSKAGYARTVSVFQDEHLRLFLVRMTPHLNTLVRRLVEKYPLRGFDAIHLASALIIREADQSGFIFACFDKRLNLAAEKEGLKVVFAH